MVILDHLRAWEVFDEFHGFLASVISVKADAVSYNIFLVPGLPHNSVNDNLLFVCLPALPCFCDLACVGFPVVQEREGVVQSAEYYPSRGRPHGSVAALPPCFKGDLSGFLGNTVVPLVCRGLPSHVEGTQVKLQACRPVARLFADFARY